MHAYLKPRLNTGSIFMALGLWLWPNLCCAGETIDNLHATHSWLGWLAIGIFVAAYLLVMSEEFIHLRKSKPVLLAAGAIWILVATAAQPLGMAEQAAHAVRVNLLEYTELFLFLLVAMTYVNAMEERQVFASLKCWLVRKGFSYRTLFWITGILAFFISPIADNLTTALLMSAVIMAVGSDQPKFVALSCINIVVAANSGGAFSPFGDITTLMVWQKGVVPFQDFLHIFIPSVISYIVPASCLYFAVPQGAPPAQQQAVHLAYGAKMVIILFLLTIVTAVSFHNFLHLPPTIGMMMGLSYLQFYGFYLKKNYYTLARPHSLGEIVPFDIFNKIQRLEWDTLLFFYGVILCVGGLATFGYLGMLSEFLYGDWGHGLPLSHLQTPANIMIGILSAIIDNIPIMFAVLTMNPTMSEGQWLLVTLTAGIGGSILSIGSAAGVALMGQARGYYTFFNHLKWSWAIILGYGLAIYAHLLLNHHLF